MSTAQTNPKVSRKGQDPRADEVENVWRLFVTPVLLLIAFFTLLALINNVAS